MSFKKKNIKKAFRVLLNNNNFISLNSNSISLVPVSCKYRVGPPVTCKYRVGRLYFFVIEIFNSTAWNSDNLFAMACNYPNKNVQLLQWHGTTPTRMYNFLGQRDEVGRE